jgi:CBS domain containing-hemolysin-like protein
VAPANLLAAIAGDFASDQDEDYDPPFVEREDGTWLISGTAAADTMGERLDLKLPEDRDFATVAGFALWRLKHREIRRNPIRLRIFPVSVPVSNCPSRKRRAKGAPCAVPGGVIPVSSNKHQE